MLMTKQKKRFSGYSIAGFILSLAIPVVVFFARDIFYAFNLEQNPRILFMGLIGVFLALTGQALSVLGLSKSKQKRGRVIAICGVVISTLDLQAFLIVIMIIAAIWNLEGKDRPPLAFDVQPAQTEVSMEVG